MNRTSKTDWQRMAEHGDEQIDTSDIPELDDAFFERAELRLPAKQPVTLRIDEDVLAWFKAQVKAIKPGLINCSDNIWGVRLTGGECRRTQVHLEPGNVLGSDPKLDSANRAGVTRYQIIGRQQQEALCLGLGNENSVEWVFVDFRQVANGQGMQ